MIQLTLPVHWPPKKRPRFNMLIFWLSYILYLYLETYLIAPHDKEVGLFRQKQPEWFLHD